MPDWMLGKWRLLAIQGDDFKIEMHAERRRSFLTVHRNSVHFEYPECVADGEMTTELDKPMNISNNYTLTITQAACALTWDIKKFPGAVDAGVIWGNRNTEGVLSLIRVSSQEDFLWTYIKDS